jgi:hypothetical protein
LELFKAAEDETAQEFPPPDYRIFPRRKNNHPASGFDPAKRILMMILILKRCSGPLLPGAGTARLLLGTSGRESLRTPGRENLGATNRQAGGVGLTQLLERIAS